MIIFQSVGTGFAPGFGMSRRLVRFTPSAPAATFRSDAYIHRLNRTLQAEMRAMSAYRSLRGRPEKAGLGEAHRLAGKELVRLIVANQGLPEDRSALSLGLTRTFIQVCEALPSKLTERAASTTLRQLEQQLVASYRKLIAVAPSRDVPALTKLLQRAVAQAGEG